LDYESNDQQPSVLLWYLCAVVSVGRLHHARNPGDGQLWRDTLSRPMRTVVSIAPIEAHDTPLEGAPMNITQLSFIPDNDRETVRAKPSVPVAKRINGRWCWLKFGTTEYVHEPELEHMLLARLSDQRKAA
jgi:hypothetical protein